MKTFRETLKDLYLDWREGQRGYSKLALDHNIDLEDVKTLLRIGFKYHFEDIVE